MTKPTAQEALEEIKGILVTFNPDWDDLGDLLQKVQSYAQIYHEETLQNYCLDCGEKNHFNMEDCPFYTDCQCNNT